MRGLVHPLDMGLVQGTCPNPALHAECQTGQKRVSFLVFGITPPRRLVVFERLTPGLRADILSFFFLDFRPFFWSFDFICTDNNSVERGRQRGRHFERRSNPDSNRRQSCSTRLEQLCKCALRAYQEPGNLCIHLLIILIIIIFIIIVIILFSSALVNCCSYLLFYLAQC